MKASARIRGLRSSGFAARAIQAAMRCADAAGRFEQFTQAAAGAVQLNGQCVGADATLCREDRQAFSIEIHAPDEVAVLLRKFRKQPLEARAKQSRFLGVSVGLKVSPVAGESSLAGAAPPVQVDDRPAQDAIKPTHGVLFGRLMLRGHGLEQALLHGVTREFAIAQAGTREGGKGIEILQQQGGGIGHRRTVARDVIRLNPRRGVRFRHLVRLSR